MKFYKTNKHSNRILGRSLAILGTALIGWGIVISPSAAISNPAIAPAPKAYTPPRNPRTPRGPFIPAGRRTGCQGDLHSGLTAIAPQQQVGQTLSTRPTLTWYVASVTPYDVQLQLYEYTDSQWVSLSDVELGQNPPGYNSYTIPESATLTVGGLYRWNIVMVCDPARPSRNRVDIADFEVVSPPADLNLSGDSPLTQAQQYAAAGLWYDAITLLTNTQLTDSQLTPDALSYRQTLLLNLAAVELPELAEQLEFIAKQVHGPSANPLPSPSANPSAE
ncbi:MAG: DUF928 domain-containing protein [Cyanobacteria bacterium J06598_1]